MQTSYIPIFLNLIKRQTCLHCGSYIRACGFLCPSCWNNLEQSSFLRKEGFPLNRRIYVDPLFDWIPNESDLLSRWLLAHKGSNHQEEWRWAISQWIRNKKPHDRWKTGSKPLILVPAPSPNGRQHATEMAEQLALILGAEVRHLLRCESDQKQQKLTRAERQLRSFEFVEEITTNDLSRSSIVLVDDVVTTGATAEAARRALGLSCLQVWCLAYRRRLAASP